MKRHNYHPHMDEWLYNFLDAYPEVVLLFCCVVAVVVVAALFWKGRK